jgi:hypothetical protein
MSRREMRCMMSSDDVVEREYGRPAAISSDSRSAQHAGLLCAIPVFFDGALNSPKGTPMTDPTKEELLARIAELEKQVGTKKTGRLEFRVSEKGGVSVYGLGRFPVTLYYEQWQRLLGASDELRKFIEENKSKLKLKTSE